MQASMSARYMCAIRVVEQNYLQNNYIDPQPSYSVFSVPLLFQSGQQQDLKADNRPSSTIKMTNELDFRYFKRCSLWVGGS